MFPAWMETLVPLGLITAALSAMGGLQGGIHKLFYGKPKLVGATEWDRLVENRDARLKEEWKKSMNK